MSKIELKSIQSGYNLSAVNDNFNKLKQTINDMLLHRDGMNELQADFDFNGFAALNVGSIKVGNKDIIEEIEKVYAEIADFLITASNLLDAANGVLSGALQDRSQGNGQVSFITTEEIVPPYVLDIPTGLQYIVGRNSLRVSYQGVLCYPDHQYREIGEWDTASSQIEILTPIPANTLVNIWISGVGNIVEIKEELEKEFEEYTQFVTETKDTINEWKNQSEAIRVAVEALKNATESLHDQTSTLHDETEGYRDEVITLKGEIFSLGEQIIKAGDVIIQNIDEIGRSYLNLIEDLGNDTETTLTALKEEATTLKEESIATMTEILENTNVLKGEINTLGENTKTAITELKDSSVTEITNLVNTSKGDITTLANTSKDEIGNLSDTAQAEISTLATTAKQEITTLTTNSTTNITNLTNTSVSTITDLSDTEQAEISALGTSVKDELAQLGTTTTTEITEIKEAAEAAKTDAEKYSDYARIWAIEEDEQVVEIAGYDTHSSRVWSLLSKENAEKVQQIKDQIGTPLTVLGRVDTVDDLPSDGENKNGDLYFVGAESDPDKLEYVYINGVWDKLGPVVNPTPVATEDVSGTVKIATVEEVLSGIGTGVLTASSAKELIKTLQASDVVYYGRKTGEIFYSYIELDSSDVHKLDGSVILRETNPEFVSYMEGLYETNPELFSSSVDPDDKFCITDTGVRIPLLKDFYRAIVEEGDSVGTDSVSLATDGANADVNKLWAYIVISPPTKLSGISTNTPGHHILEIFPCIRNDDDLNGAYPCDGREFYRSYFSGPSNPYDLLVEGKARVLTYDEWDAELALNGNVMAFALDRDNAKFRIPKITSRVYIGYEPNGNGSFSPNTLPSVEGSTGMTVDSTVPFTDPFTYVAGETADKQISYTNPEDGTLGTLGISLFEDIAGTKVTPDSIIARMFVQLASSFEEISIAQYSKIIEDLTTDSLADIETLTTTSKGEINTLKSQISTLVTDSKTEITNLTTSSKEDITSHTALAKEEVTNLANTSKAEINTLTTSSKSQITEVTNAGKTEIQSLTTELNTTVATAQTNITNTANNAITEVNTATNEALTSIEEAKDELIPSVVEFTDGNTINVEIGTFYKGTATINSLTLNLLEDYSVETNIVLDYANSTPITINFTGSNFVLVNKESFAFERDSGTAVINIFKNMISIGEIYPFQ